MNSLPFANAGRWWQFKMTFDINKYLVPLDVIDHSRVLSTWRWLIGAKSIVALTKSGDALLKDENESLFFLDVGGGTLEFIAESFYDFFEENLSYEQTEELLLPILVDKLELHGIVLKPGQVYSYRLLPIASGTYDEKNMFALDLYEHFGVTGEIHFQLKGLPDGTRIEFKGETTIKFEGDNEK
jgi:hypothetical protein